MEQRKFFLNEDNAEKSKLFFAKFNDDEKNKKDKTKFAAFAFFFK